MRYLLLFSTVASLLSSFAVANPTPATGELAADEAYVLVKLGTRGTLRQYVSSLNFAGSNTDYDLSIPKERGFQLVKVKAGTYQPEALQLKRAYAKSKTKSFDDPEKASKSIVIEPGTVTYIGKWDISFGQTYNLVGNSFTDQQRGYRVSYSVDSVQEFAAENNWITAFPLRFSHISGQNVVTTWDHLDQEQVN